MFTPGQKTFAIFFIIAFTIIMILSYRKDKKLHTKNYKGAKWVLVGFVLFVLGLFLLKNQLNS
ncbi:MAG: hypothetical protein OIF50_00750 [Flavobacteriaceae bacterium]|nr:hypothetical protein [Flavobacteriaceae bacterium]